MAVLYIDGLMPEEPTTQGAFAPANSTALLEPWGDPKECGLYQCPQGPRAVYDGRPAQTGNASFVLPRRPISRG